jgi:hypothetical protein
MQMNMQTFVISVRYYSRRFDSISVSFTCLLRKSRWLILGKPSEFGNLVLDYTGESADFGRVSNIIYLTYYC